MSSSVQPLQAGFPSDGGRDGCSIIMIAHLDEDPATPETSIPASASGSSSQGVRTGDITALLHRWRDDPFAANRLLRAVTARLRVIAGRQLATLPHESLPVSDLAQEALLPILAQRSVRFGNSRHFFVTAGYMMRRVLVDRVRRRSSVKHGGGLRRVDVDMRAIPQPDAHPHLLALEDALIHLERVDPEASRIVELRYFCGLSIDETAEALGIGRSTVVRSWRWARAWLEDRLAPDLS